MNKHSQFQKKSLTIFVRIFFLLFFLFPLSHKNFSQNNFDPIFKQIEPEQLGVKKITTIKWNKSGLMWAAYEKGILSYDGYKVTKYTKAKNDSLGLLSNKILTINIDSKDRLWISYEDVFGISIINTTNNKIKHFYPDSLNKTSIPAFEITAFKEDSKGNIWMLTWGGGFCKINPDNGKCTVFLPHTQLDNPQITTGNRVKDMLELSDGRFLMVYFTNETFGYTPNFFNPVKNKFEEFPLANYLKNCNDSTKLKIIACLKIAHFAYKDDYNKLWIGTYSGLICVDIPNNSSYRVTAQKLTDKFNLDNVKTYTLDERANLWLGTKNSGIMIVNLKTRDAIYVNHNPNNSNSISDNRIRSISKDIEGNIWASSENGIVNVYSPIIQQFNISPWQNMDLTFSNRSEQKIPVNQLLVSNDGLLYITNESGVLIYDPKTKNTVDKIKATDYIKFSKKITDLRTDISLNNVSDIKQINNNIFIFNSISFPIIFNVKEKTLNQIEFPDSIKTTRRFTRVLFRHQKNSEDIFFHRPFTNEKGQIIDFYNYNLKSKSVTFTYRLQSKISYRDNYSYVLKDGSWLLSYGETSFCLVNPKQKTHQFFSSKNKTNYFPDSTINSAYLDTNGNILFSTANGIYEFNPQTKHTDYLSKVMNIDKEPVNSVVRDHSGILWIVLDKQIVRWDPKNKKSFRFGGEFGLKIGAFFPSIAQKDEQGNIYIAGMNGVVNFSPSKFQIPYNPPTINLNFLSINRDTINYDNIQNFLANPPSLKWNKNFIEFAFGSSQIQAPLPHHFLYRLIGQDSVWQDNSISNKIRLANLSPSSYTLEVKLLNAYQIESNVLKIPFTINPPFWRTWLFYIVLLIVFAISLRLFIKQREKNYIKQQNILEEKITERTKEVLAKAQEINHQKEIIEEKNKELTDSIYYAQRIQQSILPNEEQIKKDLSQQFTFFRPKDIVSGDFYWYSKQKDSIIWAVVDCTGHGVPGGFMSMLGSGLLNQIVNEELKLIPNEILNNLRDRVIIALKQTGAYGENQDGMDITLCRYLFKSKVLQFSGANNSLYIVRNKELIELKADKQPIGIYVGEKKSFTLQEITIEQNDVVFMSSDGYPDQFGGPKGKKFKTANLEKLFVEISGLSHEEQLSQLAKAFDNWKEGYEQLDDVCIFGVKLT